MISIKWTVPFAVPAVVAGALLVLPATTLAHSLPPAAAHHASVSGSHKGPDAPSHLIQISGRVQISSNKVQLTTSKNVTYTLKAGPKWYSVKAFSGDSNQTITVQGHGSGQVFHVSQINGHSLHSSGKPPWAGLHGQGHR